MKTEDETFRKLRQVPFATLRPIFNQWLQSIWVPARRPYDETMNLWLMEHGWTLDEYSVELSSCTTVNLDSISVRRQVPPPKVFSLLESKGVY